MKQINGRCPYFSYFLFLYLGLSLSMPGIILSETETSVETKISIETSLENRLRKVLTEIAGTEKLIIIVNTELYSEKERKQLKSEGPERTILPGVPVKENIAERKIEDILAPLDIGKTKTMIKKISATIIIDKTVSSAIVEIVKKVTVGLLGIDFERGDQLQIEKINFQKNPFYWSSLFYPPNIFWIIGIALAGLFVFGSLLFLFNPFKIFSRSLLDILSVHFASQRESRSADVFGGQQTFGIATQPEIPTARSPVEPAGEKRPFWFITPERTNQLIDALRKEPPETIAVVLNYLDRNIMSKIFSSLPPDQKVKVASLFTTTRRIDPLHVKQLEQKIKDILEYSLKGEETLLSLLDYADRGTQEKVVSAIRSSDEALASRLEKLVFSFENIADFDSQTIQAIVRRTNLSVFAQVIKTMPEEFRTKVLDALPDVGKRRISQEIELGRPLPKARIEEEKIRIVELVRRLKEEGILP